MDLISRYLTRLALTRVGVVTAGMVVFLVSLDVMVNAGEVLDRRGSVLSVLLYAALRGPEIASGIIKFASLLGGLLTFVALVRRNELAPIWSTGISQLGLMRRLIPTVAAIALLQFVVDDVLMPPADATLRAWGVSGDYDSAPGRAAWFYVGDDIVRVPFDAIGTERIDGLTIFERDPDGNLVARLDAGAAVHDGEGWRLLEVTRYQIGSGTVVRDAERYWAGAIEPEDIAWLTTPPRAQSLWSLARIVREDRRGYWLPHFYATWLNVKLAALVVPALMLFLVVALAQRFQRTGHVELLFLGGLAYGFGFFIFDGIAVAMGESGLLPPIVAGWVAAVALTVVITSLTLWREVYNMPRKAPSAPE